MTAKIIELPHQTALRTPIGHVIRTGEASYKQLGHLYAQGRLKVDSVITDASKARHQREFIQSLRDSGSDIILDTKVAELSEVGKFRGHAKGAPWAMSDEDRPLIASDFAPGSNADIYGKIARHAVELGVTAVLAPSHYLRSGAEDDWLDIDLSTVPLLRKALDREGGSAIALDYPLILPHTRLHEREHRLELVTKLRGLPVDNLMVRLSGFGADAGPLTTKRTLVALEDLHRLGYPVVLDHVGGLVGLSALAYGVASGVAHGIGEHDRFDARNWHKLPKERDPESRFGRPTLVPLPGFDRSFRKSDLEAIAAVRGGRRLVACHDRHCCAHGLRSMLDNPKAHIAQQKSRAISDLFRVPDSWRVGYFLNTELQNAKRKADELSRLDTGDDRINEALVKGRKRIEDMTAMYETLAERDRVAVCPMQRRNAASGASGQGAQ
ncbi:MAG: hypothetical protein KDA64_07435 [Rhodospirillaceae bacterium]|nr:hypothetical protein [Rhodospirillaceae bacterium]